MFSFKSAVAFLVTLLILVPTLVRAHQKLERPATAKPAASFRDVDRPPKLNWEPTPQQCAMAFALYPIFITSYRVVADQQCPPDASCGSRAHTLRAPPPLI